MFASDGDPKPCKPDPMKNGLKSSKAYPDSLSIEKSCVRKSLPNVLGILINR